MYNRNTAHDFEVLERQKRKGRVVELPGHLARRKEKLKSKKTFLIAVFSAFMVSSAVVSAFIMSQVVLTEITDQTEKAYKLLDECENSNTQLRMHIEAQGASKVLDRGHVRSELVRIPKEIFAETH